MKKTKLKVSSITAVALILFSFANPSFAGPGDGVIKLITTSLTSSEQALVLKELNASKSTLSALGFNSTLSSLAALESKGALNAAQSEAIVNLLKSSAATIGFFEREEFKKLTSFDKAKTERGTSQLVDSGSTTNVSEKISMFSQEDKEVIKVVEKTYPSDAKELLSANFGIKKATGGRSFFGRNFCTTFDAVALDHLKLIMHDARTAATSIIWKAGGKENKTACAFRQAIENYVWGFKKYAAADDIIDAVARGFEVCLRCIDGKILGVCPAIKNVVKFPDGNRNCN